MEFERSTQARSWLFDKSSLAACRGKSSWGRGIRVQMLTQSESRLKSESLRQGFTEPMSTYLTTRPPTSDITPSEQEVLVQFHAHQIQNLVGPTALLLDLRTSETVLSTAITFFRRFYLSNSIIEISPRKIAAACAFFASKVEEERIEVRILVQTSPKTPWWELRKEEIWPPRHGINQSSVMETVCEFFAMMNRLGAGRRANLRRWPFVTALPRPEFQKIGGKIHEN